MSRPDYLPVGSHSDTMNSKVFLKSLGFRSVFLFLIFSVLEYFGNGEALIEQISKFPLLIPAGGRHKKGEQ